MQLNLSFLGWIHTVASVISIWIGAMLLIFQKGTTTHKWRGKAYVLAMIFTNVTALGIFSLGEFRVFHWMALGTLALVLAGYYGMKNRATRRIRLHIFCMVISYYMLIGGLINELFLHIEVLHTLADSTKSRMINMAQFITMSIFLIMLTYLMISARHHRSNQSK